MLDDRIFFSSSSDRLFLVLEPMLGLSEVPDALGGSIALTRVSVPMVDFAGVSFNRMGLMI